MPETHVVIDDGKARDVQAKGGIYGKTLCINAIHQFEKHANCMKFWRRACGKRVTA